jgi:hypothetical protein
MKKIILCLLFLSICSYSYSQIKTVDISKKNIGGISCRYANSIDLNKGDTLTFLYFGFQNAKYTAITDIVSIMFVPKRDSLELFEFVKSLKMALSEMGSKSAITWTKDKYQIRLYDFSDGLYLYEARQKGDGHIILYKNEVSSLINWIDSLGITKKM